MDFTFLLLLVLQSVYLGNSSAGFRIGAIGKGNIISGAASHGIFISGIDNTITSFIQGNRIGTDITGTSSVPNVSDGIHITSSKNIQIGGLTGGEGNLVSGNTTGAGIHVQNNIGSSIIGNLIGTTANGNAPLGNREYGITIAGPTPTSSGILIDGNVISGSTGAGRGGIEVLGGTGHQIINNKIGTNQAGTGAIPNTDHGISLGRANRVVTNTTIQNNLISGNGTNGVYIQNGTGNTIVVNKIGVQIDGITPLPNIGNGILLSSFGTGAIVDNNIVGTLIAGQGNIIAYNGGRGVRVDINTIGTSAKGNDIIGNAIFCNAGTDQIRLASNGNNTQAAPTITSTTSTSVTGGGIDGDDIHLYRNNGTCPTRTQEYLGTATVASGTWTISGLTINPNDELVATQTNGTNGTSPFFTFVVPATPTITLGTITPTAPYCAGTTISVLFTTTGTFNGGNTFTAQLSDENGLFNMPSPIATAIGTNPISLVIPAGATAGAGYKVRIVSSDPVVNSDESAGFTVNPLPTATIAYTGSPFCSDAANPTPTITGTTGGTFSSTAGLVFVSTATGQIDLMASTAGTYTITYTIAAGGGCTVQTATTSVIITTLPTATIAYTGSPFCSDAANPTPTITGTTGGTFSSTAGLVFVSTATGQIDLMASTAGTYTITYTIAAGGGCTVQTTTTSVIITTLPTATIAYTGSPFCSDATNPTPTITGTTGGTFSSTAGLVFVSTATGQIDLMASTAGTYTITYTIAAGGGCTVQTATTSVIITTLPTATIAYTGSPFCSDAANPTPTITGTTGGTFSSTAGLVFVSTATGEINLATSTAGTYTITYTIAAGGGCTAQTATTSVIITTLPTATIAYTGSPFCSDAANPTPTITGTTGGTFSSTAGLVFVSTATGQINLMASTAGAYTITYTIAAGGGCTAQTTTTSVIITTLPTATIAYTGSPFCSDAANPTPTITGTTGGTFSSTAGLVFVSTATGQIDLMASTAGAYTITYTIAAGGGCTAQTTTTSVTVNPIPVAPTITGTTTICSGSTTTLSTTAGGTVRWYDVPTGGTALASALSYTTPALTANTTYYTEREENGCISPRTVTLVEIETTPPSIITCPPNRSISTGTSNCQGTIPDMTGEVVENDNCTVASITQSPTAGTLFGSAPGDTQIVTMTVTDNAGNSTSCSVTLTLEDDVNPIIPTLSDITVSTDLGTCVATFVVANPTGTDNCGTVTFTNNAPATFPIGTTTITWTADDGNGNTVTADQDVIVIESREINVLGNGMSITDADNIPDTGDNTDFGATLSRTVVYTIENTGTEILDISSITSSGAHAGDFAIDLPIPTSVAPSGTQTFSVTFTPSGIGTRTAVITINNDDCNEGVYDFAVEGIQPILQEINIRGNSNTILNGSTSVSNTDHTLFNDILSCGNAISIRRFTIESLGLFDLTVSSISVSNPKFVIQNVSSFPLTLPSSVTAMFDIFFSSATAGTETATVTIVNNDPVRSTYTFVIQATANPDTQRPVISAMPDFIREADPNNCYFSNTSSNFNERIPEGTVSDNCSIAYDYVLTGATTLTANFLSRVNFNTGVTRVSWTARDGAGNVSNTDEFIVTVNDTTTPTIKAPNDTTFTVPLYNCIVSRSNVDIGTPIVSDNCLFRIFNNAPAQFSSGQTTVVWTAIDSAGNSSTSNQIITIEEQPFVVPSDSLILVQLYNGTGGASWDTAWNLNAPVSTWKGITVKCGRVASINLSNNNLTGTLPTSVLNLARRTQSDFSLNIAGNRLDFESAEDFVDAIPDFTYSPQADIYSSGREIIRQGQAITFTSQTPGNFNRYQWYKDGTAINGATNPILTLSNVLPSDAGVYTARVRNTRATNLTLERRPITLQVEGFVNIIDSLALVTIFEQTEGTSWTNVWDLTQPVATWQGVTLSGDKLIELDLSSTNMSGILPDVFDAELFSELRYLSFFNNDLQGQIPASLGAIITLTYLDLDQNNFEGSVPASFGNLINLQAFWLSRNNLTSLPDEIGNMISLKTLYLNGNNFAQLPEALGNLKELLVLNISDNELINLPNSITNLTKLVELYANRNYITAIPAGMQNLVDLRVFEINANKLVSLPNGLLQLDNLSSFKVSENELEFDDLLPFAQNNYTIFDYSPQAPINEEDNILVTINTRVSFAIQTQGNGNRYEWFRNGNPVATTQTLVINRVNSNDAGRYRAEVRNPSLPNLVLRRRQIELNIECQTGLDFKISQPNQTVFCEGQPFGLRLEVDKQFSDTREVHWRKDGIILAFANEKSYTVTQAGKYTAEVLTSDGCTVRSNTVEITVLSQPKVSIDLIDKTLTSKVESQNPVTYQWLRDGVVIETGFESTYEPTITGEYSLLVLTESGCSSVSETIIFTQTITGIEEPEEFRNLAIFPNPNNGNFFIDFGTSNPNGEPNFVLIDAIGRKIVLKKERIYSTRYKVNTNSLPGGMYYLQIQTKDGLAFRKFVIEE